MKDSERIIAALQENSEKLIEQNWLEAWGYRAVDRPLRLNVQHVITPAKDGGYKLRSVIGFGIRVSHGVDAEVTKANDSQKLARFPETRAA